MYRLPMMSFRPLFAVAAMGALTATPALGAWSAPEQASRGPLPSRAPDVAANARGDAAAAWVRGARRDAMIVVSVRPAGGDWSDPVAVSRRGRPAIDPDVAIDAHGRVIIAWRQVVRIRTVAAGGGRRRQAVYVVRTRDRVVTDARWSRITTLSSERQKVGPPELAVDDDGLAVATWHWGTGTSPGDRGYIGQVQFAERRADGSWSGPARLSRSPLCAQVRLPRVAVGRSGHATIWWQCDLPSDRSTALARTRSPGTDFGNEVELPFRTAGDVTADLAIDADGSATAVSADGEGSLSWWRGDVDSTLTLRELPALGSPDRLDPLAKTGGPAIAVNSAGDALSGWVDSAGRPGAAPVASDLGVGAASRLGPSDPAASSPRVAVGDQRHGVVAWVAGGRIVASTRSADGTVATGGTVSGSGVPDLDPPAVAMDATGDATLFWTRVSRGRSVVERSSSAP